MCTSTYEQKIHEKWWDANVGSQKYLSINTFKSWVESAETPSRKVWKTELADPSLFSVLDVGCGPCIDHHVIKQINASRSSDKQIIYSGVDVSRVFVDAAVEQGLDVKHGSADAIPHSANSFDVASCRHLLEHLPHYGVPLDNLIRVASKKVLVTFFLPPHTDDVLIDRVDFQVYNDRFLYHNVYSKKSIESFLKQHRKVRSFEWKRVNTEELLVIVLRSQ